MSLLSELKKNNYIIYRKALALANRCASYLCRIFPIDNTLISVCTFEGKGGFGCNPKYLVTELHRRNPNYKFVWFLNQASWDKEFPDYIKKVPNTWYSRAYWLARSKVWIDNYRKPYGTTKRAKQYYLNVNHYTVGIKCTGLWRANGFSPIAYMVSKNDSDMIDDLVIDSRWCETVSPKGLVYDGTYQLTGAPRCDILYGDRLTSRLSFRQKHGLPDDAKVIMFAPTFREGSKDGKRFVFSEIWSIDFRRLINALKNRFGCEWYICVRVHPQLAPSFKTYSNPDVEGLIIDESQADDMYELLAAMDAYITDYSSACFEAGYAHIPVFLYADDVTQYATDRGALMWNLATDDRHNISNNKSITSEFNVKLPFTLARNNDELESDILNFNNMQYDAQLDKFHEAIGLVFNGTASSKLADTIESFLN